MFASEKVFSYDKFIKSDLFGSIAGKISPIALVIIKSVVVALSDLNLAEVTDESATL